MDAFTGKAELADNHFPEDWLGSTTVAMNGQNQQYADEGLSRIKIPNGSYGPFFRDILKQHPEDALGQDVFSDEEGLGVLCKFLDSAIRLPIQCHPDIPFAQKYYNSDHGKAESWFILGTRKINNENPYILMGFKEDVDPDKFKDAVRQQNIVEMEQSLHRVEVTPGQMYFIPGRMPHAIGPGVFLLEVQEPTDWVVQPERFIGDTELTPSDMWGPLEPETGLDCFDYKGRDTKDNILKRVSLSPVHTEKINSGLIEKIIGPNITPCFSVVSNVEERVKKVVAQTLKVDLTQVASESRFVEDLGAESIQSIELVAAFEEEFDLEMDEHEALSVKTVEGAVEFIENMLRS